MSDLVFGSISGKKTALTLDHKDNVGVALVDLAAGEVCTVIEDNGNEYEIAVIENIPFGHKFALADFKKDQAVFKYGEEIGKMKEIIQKGGWIHNHNMYCDRGMK